MKLGKLVQEKLDKILIRSKTFTSLPTLQKSKYENIYIYIYIYMCEVNAVVSTPAT
jgi:hypothetical protein